MNAAKTWLVTKKEHESLAISAFKGTGVEITTESCPYLGAPIGTRDYVESFIKERVHK